MKNILFIAMGVILFAACNSSNQENSTEQKKETPQAESKKSTTPKTNSQTTSGKSLSNNASAKIPSMNIQAGDRINSPLELKINSQGVWAGQDGELGTIIITDDEGRVLGQGVMNADGEWEKEGPVLYSTKIQFDPKGAKTGRLKMISKPGAGPGLGEADKYEYEMPVNF